MSAQELILSFGIDN